jgi:hypothetical protein
LAGGPPLDLGELPIPVDADAQPLETQPALRPDPRGTPGRGASRYPGAGELGDTYRSGAARGGRGGVAWSAGAAGGRQVTLSPGGGAGGLAGSAAEREADLAGMEETESAIREIFADLLDDTAPPPSGGAASPVLP